MILVNGERSTAVAGSTVRELLTGLAVSERGIAVAVDSEVVPRGEWDTFEVADGMAVEILTAVQGG